MTKSSSIVLMLNFCIFSASLLLSEPFVGETDFFAEIGNKTQHERTSYLEEKSPPKFKEISSDSLIGVSPDTLVYYVSIDGKDSNKGTLSEPFGSIEKALSAIELKRGSNTNIKATVVFKQGSYTYDKTVFLNKNHANITIKGTPKGKVSFNGGVSISLSQLEQTTLPATAFVKERTVYVIDLQKHGVQNFGKVRNVGFARPYGPSWGELFVNHEPMHLSRWPNESTVPIGEVLDEGSIPRFDDFSNRGGIIRYDNARIDQWSKENNVWISGYFRHGYADDMVQLSQINVDKKTFKTASPTLYGFGHGKPWNTWFGVNILAELDADGEYYVDTDNGKLYFIYSKNEIETLEFSVLETPFIQIEHTNNITIEGITFEVSRGIGLTMDNTENITIQNCVFRNLGSLGIAVGKGIEPFRGYPHQGTGELKSGIVGSLQQHLYANTMTHREGGKNNRIISCEFYQLGAGGVSMGGGNRITLEKGNNSVENSILHDVNRVEKSYRAPIHLTGVGNSIMNCEIYNAPSMAILLHGNEHRIEYNDIHDVCREVDDQGAIYYGRDPSERGHKVFYNYFHHIDDTHRTTAVYHDDGACGMEVFGNIFYRAGSLPVLIGGGMDNPYSNNIFIGGDLAVHVDNRLQNWSKATLENNGVFDKRLQAVNYKYPPYSTSYPQLVKYWEDNPAIPKRNTFSKNIFYKVKNIYNGKSEWMPFLEDNWITTENPGFVNEETLDFNLEKGAKIYQQVPGFKPIPFDKIGVQNRSGSN
ncbi:right-handed parallel beta-helix repeat-containing protein [Arenibacter sp. 6A1]|uniref:right-handed parallel beta-helix repeat-containing protein n=1 Tax=Arenibacter sp. 6A1 TaxID=2720391 RepID=UPI00197B48A1|nr:right-handed parallel beta-helix repeat-containing protein [Arenibacter sp. 6A1]